MLKIGTLIVILSGVYQGCHGRITGFVRYAPEPAQYQVELKCPNGVGNTDHKGTVHEWLWSDRTKIEVQK